MMLTALLFVWLQLRPPQVCTIGQPNCAPIHGKLLSTQIACIKTYEDGFIEYKPCEISAPPTTQFVEPVAQQFKKLAQRAADETDLSGTLPVLGWHSDDGPPHKPWDEVDGMCGGAPPHPCNEPPAEPVDLPAVQEPIEAAQCFERYDGCQVTDEKGRSLLTAEWLYYAGDFAKLKYSRQSCADKSRVLLTSEDGKKHCIKFPEAK